MNVSCRPVPASIHIHFLLALLLACLAGIMTASDVSAHAELVRADPPVNGLVLAPPAQITLFFSEEISASASVGLLDAQGKAIGTSSILVGANGDFRQLSVNIPSLDPGTYTVTWSAESSVDGHQLSGTYAFRVGGGLPPGLATVEGENPAPWAVAARWLTFLGVSAAVGAFLFRLVIVPDSVESSSWARRRSRLILTGAFGGLLATIAEPVLQVLFDDRGGGLATTDIFRGLPAGWWWRPAMLVPLAVLGAVIAYPMRNRLPRPLAWLGCGLALGSLLGLALTSHAAGRESWREIAVISNVLHQWSGALWIGGLISLAAWITSPPRTHATGADRRSPIARFSTLALALFGIAVLTGIVNAGFIFPFVADIRRDGLSLGVFDPLWNSRYGVILTIKIAFLVIPFCLAVYHRSSVVRLAAHVGDQIAAIPRKMRRTLPLEAILVVAVVLGGSTITLSAPPHDRESIRDYTTLIAPARTATGDEPMLAHLTVTPARQGENELIVRLTDWNGAVVPVEPAPRVALDFMSLDHDVSKPGVALQPADLPRASWKTSGLDLSLEGWWQVTARINQEGMEDAAASFFLLLPDPNTNGFDAGPKPGSSAEAEALFRQGLATMTSWRSARWTEFLGTGDDVLVIAQLGVVDGGGQRPNAYEVSLRYSGGFAPPANDEPPRPPTFDTRHSITVGEQSWLSTTDGQWLEQPPGRFDVPAQWGRIYEAGQNFRLGGMQTIGGEDARIVSFYSPAKTGQSEAWFAWWIGANTGNVLQITMIAQQHYMMWQYTDINGDLSIDPPVDR